MPAPALASPNSPPLIVPNAIEAVIADFDARTDSLSSMDVYGAVCEARQALSEPSAAENAGAWSEVLAFGLDADRSSEKPWGTHFGPIGSRTDAEGVIHYMPDAREANSDTLAHWKARAASVTAPVLSARYNDLVWDMSRFIANERPDVAFARRAINAYLAAAQQEGAAPYETFPAAARALGLARQIGDAARTDAARAVLLALHRKVTESRGAWWWKAWEIFEAQSQCGLTEAERQILVDDLEVVLTRASDTTTPGSFNPHDVESVAKKLIPFYRSAERPDDVRRLHLAVGRAFEHFGRMGDALLATMVLQTSIEAYRAAGSAPDETRVLRLQEERALAAGEEMTAHEFRQEIPNANVEAFLAEVIQDAKEATFKRLAQEFLTYRAQMENSLDEVAQVAPLSTFIPQTILSGNRIIAEIGPLAEDRIGHLIRHTSQHIALSTVWLGWALQRARERHALTADDIAGWANRAGIFGNGVLLKKGIEAWLADDHVAAAHILIPKIEAAFRALLSQIGQTTTKPHKQMRQARMVITLGDLLFHADTPTNLGPNGPDLVLYMRCLYADPRGRNWRNDLAHGLISDSAFDTELMLWVVHTLLLLGVWLEPRSTPAALDLNA